MINTFFNKILLNQNISRDISICKHFIENNNTHEQVFENFKISENVTITTKINLTQYYDEVLWKSNKNEIELYYIISGSTKLYKSNIQNLDIINENEKYIFYSNSSMENEVHFLQSKDFSLIFPSQAEKFGICLDSPQKLTYAKFTINLSEV